MHRKPALQRCAAAGETGDIQSLSRIAPLLNKRGCFTQRVSRHEPVTIATPCRLIWPHRSGVRYRRLMDGKEYLVSVTTNGSLVEARIYSRETPARVLACVVCVPGDEGQRAAALALERIRPSKDVDRTRGRHP
jgi:hypothetical protein